jgi:hypothetical protein
MNRVTPYGVSIIAVLVTNCQRRLAAKEMTLDLLFSQDQGSSIVDGINHLRNLLLSIDLLMESLLSTLDSLLFCIFIIHPVRAVFKMGCYIRIYAKSYEN